MDQFIDHLKTQFPNHKVDERGFWRSGVDSSDTPPKPLSISWLSQYQLLSVVGPDASKFLQGQTSCDWRKVDDQHASYGSHCNIKGRVMCSFLGFMPGDDNIQLRLRSDITDGSAEIFKKYIVFSKATLSQNSEQLIGLGISGSQARTNLAEALGDLPEAPMQSRPINGGSLIQLPGSEERFECWLSPTQATALWDKLAGPDTVSDSEHWERQNIAAGIAEVCAASQDEFIPQLLNYPQIGAVSFTKGCYTGQEIVARMQYRGKQKRRLVLAELASTAPATGSDLFQGENSQAIGQLVSAVNTEQGCELLAVMTHEAADSGQVHLQGDSNTLQINPLPYPVENQE